MSERGTSELQCHRGSSTASGGTPVTTLSALAAVL
jgi:hypothetical protein